ncbi:MAG: 5-guanidino-2-oxopentanoate decarboxylase [Pseudomonadota bacterium]|nr:5-guanidino-2-oxopentanoate decarboxylase [Pseudomonadota bacterium]
MPRSIGCYLVELLAANGIDTVFGIPGVHNLELYRGLAACKMRHVLVRHEQGAGFAADGYARLSGRVAAAFTISGPGLTNILTAAGQAYTDSVPFLVVASTPVRASLGKQWGVLHELHDQLALASGVFGVARTAGSAEDVRDNLRVCLDSLRGGRTRPAYLEIPLDVLGEQTSLPARRFADPAPDPEPHERHMSAALRVLEKAARPVVIAGGGARAAAVEVRQLVETLGCALVTTAAGKGILADAHPANLGTSLPFPATQTLISEADAVVAIGTELSETDLFNGLKLPITAPMIRIDIDRSKLADHYDAEVAICGDASIAVQILVDRLTAPGARSRPSRVDAGRHRALIDATFDAGARAQIRVLQAIRAALPADGAVFSDMTQIAYLGNYAFAAEAPGQWFHPSGYGTLGFALPAAIGAKVSSPERAVLALAGDFGLQFTINELATAVEEKLTLPVVVWNNAALGQIRDDMQAAHIPLTGVIGLNPDFTAVAAAYGAAAARVSELGALAAALRSALAASGPTLIEVVAADFIRGS